MNRYLQTIVMGVTFALCASWPAYPDMPADWAVDWDGDWPTDDAIESMFICLKSYDHRSNINEVGDCVHELSVACILLDPPGSFGKFGADAVACFDSLIQTILRRLNVDLIGEIPNDNSIGSELRKVAIKYSIRRQKLECEFVRELLKVKDRSSADLLSLEEVRTMNRVYSGCLMHGVAISYWKLVVLGRMY